MARIGRSGRGAKDQSGRKAGAEKGRYANIRRMARSVPTLEGAGVRLSRAFGYADASLDPFLLLDEFKSDNPDDYLAGFPWHPHRGIETITYVIEGEVRHGDSLGNKGTIASGDVQWMTAGSGIIHEEMPREYDGLMQGFQLWANLPADEKMMKPRYRDVEAASIPTVNVSDGVHVKVVAGEIAGQKGPVTDIVTDPSYLDVRAEQGKSFRYTAPGGHNMFAYVFDGGGYFDGDSGQTSAGCLIVFENGAEARVEAGDDGVRFLLASGRPLREPVAWRGPIVMNTEEELDAAFLEYQRGTFIKNRGRPVSERS